MSEVDIRKHILKKFIFPKTLIVDKPGVILNYSISRFSKRKSFTRVIFMFEDFFVNLHKSTCKKIGFEETSKLWYSIGRDVGLRYLSFSGSKKFPKFLIAPLSSIVFDALSGAGLGFFKLNEEKSTKDVLFVEGKHALIIRHLNDGAFFSGILSGIFSYLYGVDFEVVCTQCGGEKTSFKLIKKESNLTLPAHVTPSKFYLKMNGKLDRFNGFYEQSTLSDFLKFKKIKLDSKMNTWNFEKHSIFPSEVGLFGLILYNYQKKGLTEVLKNSYLVSSEKIFAELIPEVKIEDKLKYFFNISSALGWGVARIEKFNSQVKIKFICPPYSRYGFLDRAFFFNGALNVIYKKKFKLMKCTNHEFIYSF